MDIRPIDPYPPIKFLNNHIFIDPANHVVPFFPKQNFSAPNKGTILSYKQSLFLFVYDPHGLLRNPAKMPSLRSSPMTVDQKVLLYFCAQIPGKDIAVFQ